MIQDREVFDSKTGAMNRTEIVGDIIDTILILHIIKGTLKPPEINLELRRCGLFISMETQQKILNVLIKEGSLTLSGRTNN